MSRRSNILTGAAVVLMTVSLFLSISSATSDGTGRFQRSDMAPALMYHEHPPIPVYIDLEPPVRPDPVCWEFRARWGKELPFTDEEIWAILDQSATRDITIEMALAVMEIESHFDRDAVGKDGKDFGYFQIRISNHEWLKEETGADPMDPIGNIICGLWLLRYDMDMAGNDPRVALTIYRWGHDTGDRTYAKAVLACMDVYTERSIEFDNK